MTRNRRASAYTPPPTLSRDKRYPAGTTMTERKNQSIMSPKPTSVTLYFCYCPTSSDIVSVATIPVEYVPASELERLEAERDRYKAALEDAIEFADEGWSYASPYFIEKWDYAGHRAKLVTALAQTDTGGETE